MEGESCVHDGGLGFGVLWNWEGGLGMGQSNGERERSGVKL